MIQFLIVVVLVAAVSNAEEEPFSIGLGVLSPSYSQTVGKENVKVKYDQKENGQFSYSVGDPGTGNNQYLSFGPSAGQQEISPAGYAAPVSSQPTGYEAPSYGNANSYSGSNSAYNGPSGFYGQQGSAPSSFGASDFYGGSARKPEGNSAGILPAGFSYHATEGQAFLRQGGELREPQGNQGQIMPAGFSYHATDGQSFLRQGDTPNFAIAEDKQSTGRGPAEQSFYHNYQSNQQQGGRGLVNGLVGYGPGGPSRGGLPIGGYAGPEFQGAHKEHGGHTE